MRGDHGAGVVRRRSREAADLHPPVRLERTRHDAEGWAIPARAADKAIGRGLGPASALAERACSLPGRCGEAVDAADGPDAGEASGTQGWSVESRSAHLATHVLLALVDAWCASTGNSGIGGTQGPVDDAALHAPEPGSARRRDSAA